jgi:polysaccharide pyruvyl transferase WcaK-like protein
MTGAVLKRAECLTVRDESSRQTLIGLGVPASRVHTTSDPVINFSDSAHRPAAAQAGKNILVCLRHWFDTIDWLPVSVVNALHIRSRENVFQYDNFVSNMADILDHVARDPDVTLTFVPFWGVRDTRVHRAVIAKMQRSTQCKVIQDSPSPERAAQLIRSADLIIGMRLHSLILAVASARPFFAIDYSKKVGDFLEEVLPGRASLVSCSPRDLVAAEVIAKLDALERASPFDSAYVRRIGELKLKERENIALLRGLLNAARALQG